jgi:Na+/H+ antiporter NhaD/arsenite permease-like protein
MIASDAISVDEAARAIHLPTILLLFAFMVVSAQMRLGGFYDWVTVRLAAMPV